MSPKIRIPKSLLKGFKKIIWTWFVWLKIGYLQNLRLMLILNLNLQRYDCVIKYLTSYILSNHFKYFLEEVSKYYKNYNYSLLLSINYIYGIKINKGTFFHLTASDNHSTALEGCWFLFNHFSQDYKQYSWIKGTDHSVRLVVLVPEYNSLPLSNIPQFNTNHYL